MKIVKGDIRLIDGDFISSVQATREYLHGAGYTIEHVKLKRNISEITAKNLQQSFLKLYFSNKPQIVHFHLEKRSVEQIQIKIKCDLFIKFRFFYYSIIISLLTGSNAFLLNSITYNQKIIIPIFLKFDSYSSFCFMILMALLCFVSACFFYMRSISTFPYENFMNQFYEFLKKKGFLNKSNIHVGHSFPDMWKVLLVMGIFSIPIFLVFIFDSYNSEHTFLGLFLYGALIIVGLFFILLILMHFQPTLKARMFFSLVGFSFCIPILIYFSPPIILSITGDLNEFFKTYIISGYPQKIIQYGSIFYLSSFLIIIVLAFASLLNTLHLPIRIIMQLDKSKMLHPMSYFNRSLQSDKKFLLFNFLIIFLWGIFWSIKIYCLYLSLGIIEKSLFDSNHFFNPSIAILFYENTKTCLIFLFQSNINPYFLLIFHKIMMLIYSSPMVVLVFIILKNNFKSRIREYYLAKKQPDDYAKDKKILSNKIKEICEFANVRIPIVKVFDSTKIRSKTKFIGFPLFRNILMVSKGALHELNNNEGELDILLSHEIGHIKKHTFTRRFLCTISDFSIFGNGFLALLQNSFKIEREADDFAVNWVANKRQDVYISICLLKSLLERIEEVNWKTDIFSFNGYFHFSIFKIDHCRTAFIKMFNESSRLQKIKLNLYLFYQIYFSEEIQSYFHPSNNQRIEWAMRNNSTYATN